MLNTEFPATDRDLLEAGAAFVGSAMSAERRLEIAEVLFRGALSINNQNQDALSNLATVSLQKGMPKEARGFAIQSVAIKPSNWAAWAILGQANGKLGEFLDARLCIQRAIELEPNRSELWYMLAGHWEIAREYAKCEECYKKALELNPNDLQNKFSWGIIKMLRGDFAYGLPMYEARLEHFTPKYPVNKATSIAQDLREGKIKSIVIEAEQGVGDLFQMARYAPMLKHHGIEHITLHCPDVLVGIMKRFDGFDQVTGYSENWSPRYPTISAMSLPYVAMLIGEDIYQPVAMINLSNLEKITSAKPMIIGVCHKGNPQHANDRFRSISKEEFSKIESSRGTYYDLSIPTGTWEDTLSSILACDLIITVDTAIGHLAGSIGKEVWMLVASVPDWRWGTSGETSKWYPGMRIFRQAEPLKWEPVIERVVKYLKAAKLV